METTVETFENSTIQDVIDNVTASSCAGVPSWEEIKHEIKWVFLLHSYCFACSFLVLAFFSFFSILNIRSLITSRPYMSTINVFLCILGASRAACLFIDPYNLRSALPRALSLVIWDAGLPSITSALTLLQLALLQLSQLRFGPDIIRNKSALSLVITLHFTCVIAVDISLTLNPSYYLVKYGVETLFMMWGLALCGSLTIAGYRAMKVLGNLPAAMLERDIEIQYKGIMQLAMLAPYNNLASSVCAALVPTLLAPKMMQQVRQSQLQAQEACFTTVKTEPVKSCIASKLNNPKPSPSHEASDIVNSDSDETKVFIEGKEKRTKKLSWGTDQRNTTLSKREKCLKNKSISEEEVEETAADTTLLPGKAGDLTLQTILNHIAYVNRAKGGGTIELGSTGITRKHQVTTVLRLTCATSILTAVFIFTQILLLYSPSGLLWCGPRSWLGYQTTCRSLELIIAWAMANLTKQPVSRGPHYTGTRGPAKSMFM